MKAYERVLVAGMIFLALFMQGGRAGVRPLQPIIPQAFPSEYANAERNAPQADRLDLENLRRQGREQGWKFQVGYTSAFRRPLDTLAGTKIPQNFLAIAAAQNRHAAKANGVADETIRLASGGEAPEYLSNCSPSLTAFDWRTKNVVSDVTSQGNCGSCWAFAAASTFDAAYNIRNNAMVDVSEQHILNCATGNDGRAAGSCAGGWYDPVYQWLIRSGVSSNASVPYVEARQACFESIPGHYRAYSTGFVSDKTSIPTIRDIKDGICKYGPVASTIAATTAFQAYVGGYFNEGSDRQVNHAISIIGWDDHAGGTNHGAWLIKNSWSKLWGQSGYAWVAYDTNKIGYATAWVRPVQNDIRVPTDALQVAWRQSLPALQQAASVADAPPGTMPLESKNAVVSLPFTTLPGGAEIVNSARLSANPIFIQYDGAEQKLTAAAIRATLTKEGYFAPSIRDLTKKGGKYDDEYQIRYFDEKNQKIAQEIKELLEHSGLVHAFSLVQPPNQPVTDGIEIWFPRRFGR